MRYITLILILFTLGHAQAQVIEAYEGRINLKSLKIIEADFEISFLNKNKSNSLHLFINKNADIKSITLNKKPIDYQLQNVKNDLPDIKKIIIQDDFPKSFKLNISYDYSLEKIENKTFTYDPKWIELNNFTGWFPFNRENTNFKYNLDFQIPASYKLISSGNITKKHAHWIISNNKLQGDIPVVIADEFETFYSDNRKIVFYTVKLTSEQRKAILNDANDIIKFYERRFGDVDQDKLVIAINPFAHPWSYTRKGFISMSLKDSYQTSDRLRMAHEIGHLWWSNNKVYGNGNDWLDEAFAEYSSLIWYKQYAPHKEYDELLQKYQDAFNSDVKITDVKPVDNNFVSITYFKGAYLLYDLHQRIGDQKMMEILSEVNDKQIDETSEFLQILRERLDANLVREFKKHLL